jgi:hypothetical protein
MKKGDDVADDDDDDALRTSVSQDPDPVKAILWPILCTEESFPRTQ